MEEARVVIQEVETGKEGIDNGRMAKPGRVKREED